VRKMKQVLATVLFLFGFGTLAFAGYPCKPLDCTPANGCTDGCLMIDSPALAGYMDPDAGKPCQTETGVLGSVDIRGFCIEQRSKLCEEFLCGQKN
ncbi:MAG: hypothetical protein NT027_04925, partial [Proteobacteria bacterium]|nr:hypothetical protein [Pseudomonadota bacterium]